MASMRAIRLRLAGRAGRDAVLHRGHDRVVGVGLLRRDAGQEEVAGNLGEGLQHGRGRDLRGLERAHQRGVALAGCAGCARRGHGSCGCAAFGVAALQPSQQIVLGIHLARLELGEQILGLGRRPLQQRGLDDARLSERVDRVAGVSPRARSRRRRARARRRPPRRCGPRRRWRPAARRQGGERLEQRRAARRLGELDRRLGVGARLQLGARDHDHLRRQHALGDQQAARRAHGLAQVPRPHVLDQHHRGVLAVGDRVGQPTQVLEREARRGVEGLRLELAGPVDVLGAVEPEQVRARAARPRRPGRRSAG